MNHESFPAADQICRAAPELVDQVNDIYLGELADQVDAHYQEIGAFVRRCISYCGEDPTILGIRQPIDNFYLYK